MWIKVVEVDIHDGRSMGSGLAWLDPVRRVEIYFGCACSLKYRLLSRTNRKVQACHSKPLYLLSNPRRSCYKGTWCDPESILTDSETDPTHCTSYIITRTD